MKGERIKRKRIAIETGCSEWDGVQGLCIQHGECACLTEARKSIKTDKPENTSVSAVIAPKESRTPIINRYQERVSPYTPEN